MPSPAHLTSNGPIWPTIVKGYPPSLFQQSGVVEPCSGKVLLGQLARLPMEASAVGVNTAVAPDAPDANKPPETITNNIKAVALANMDMQFLRSLSINSCCGM
jgi:hypothetical protein